ncbi:hypothetical protein K8S19_03105 [bacterium]|nr:hypothetical protein [bacterium]
MGDFFYRASFYLYEISFLMLAAALFYNSISMWKINRALKHPPYWIWSAAGAVLLAVCAINHFHVYHHLSPQYLKSAAQDLLIRMYVLKTVSMFCILGAGIFLGLSNFLYIQKINQK